MHRRTVLLLATVGALMSSISPARGQFATDVDAPPSDIPPYSSFGSDTQLNLRAGSYVGEPAM